MEISIWFVIAVFTLGAAVGGLVVNLQRECAIEQIRREFEQQLTQAVERRSASERTRESGRNTGQNAATAPPSPEEDPEIDECSWISTVFPPPQDSGCTHVNQ